MTTIAIIIFNNIIAILVSLYICKNGAVLARRQGQYWPFPVGQGQKSESRRHLTSFPFQ
jgi:hypothetical protein